jgi:hypothetical protein
MFHAGMVALKAGSGYFQSMQWCFRFLTPENRALTP